MNETLRQMIALVLMLLVTFTMQSLPLVLCRSTLYKVIPMVMFWVPLQCIVDTAWETGDLWGAVMEYAVILLPMILGNILGWVIGLRFRKILDDERISADADSDEEHP